MKLFLLIDLLLIIIAGIVVFKNFNTLKKVIYWLVFPSLISVWFKKLEKEEFKYEFKFELFALLSALLIGINYLVFRYILKMM
jgi:hypothetical protein